MSTTLPTSTSSKIKKESWKGSGVDKSFPWARRQRSWIPRMQSATFQRIPHLATDVYFKSKARVASWKHCLSNRRFRTKSEKGRKRHVDRCVLRTKRFVWQNSNAKLTILGLASISLTCSFPKKGSLNFVLNPSRNLLICAHFRVIAISNYIGLKSFSSAVSLTKIQQTATLRVSVLWKWTASCPDTGLPPIA